MKVDLVIKIWKSDTTIQSAALVYLDGCWWLSSNPLEEFGGPPEFYIELPRIPDMDMFAELDDLRRYYPDWEIPE